MPFLPLLFWVFFAIVVLQLCYLVTFLLSYAIKASTKSVNDVQFGVSVIICAKNEADNLREHIPYILNQDHDNFELILVNDGSLDETLEVMEGFAEVNSSVKVVNAKHVESFWGNKKYALTLGIKAARKSYLVFTDADCKPKTPHWLKEIAGQFSHEKRIVLGYGAHAVLKKSMLNKLIRFETLFTAIQYFSYAKLGVPYMGVGRNLAYHKDVFFDNAGFMKHMAIMSGDDDLFINQVANKTNVAIVDSAKSITVSKPKLKFTEWFKQKRRHVTTSQHYKWYHKLMLGIFYTSQLSFLILAVVLLSVTYMWPYVLGLILIRFVISSWVVMKVSKKLSEPGLLLLAPFLEMTLILVQFFIFSTNLISKPKHWN